MNGVQSIDYSLIVWLAITAVIVIAVLIAVSVIKRKLREVSQTIFGTNSLLAGISKQKQEMCETPCSLHSMTSIYLPQITKDFPQFDYELYKNKAKSVLRSYLGALQSRDVSMLYEECSDTLKNNVKGIIRDLTSRKVTPVFKEIVIHDVQISRYIKNGATVIVLFELSVGYYSYGENSKGDVVYGDRDLKTQTVYEVGLVYVQNADMAGAGDAVGVNCPNCGAPVTNLGQKFCEYCSSSIVEVNERVWRFNSVHEMGAGRKQY